MARGMPRRYDRLEVSWVLTGAVVAGCELVFVHFPAECVAVNSEDLCGAGLVAVGAVKDTLDEPLFKFAHSLIE